MYKILFFFACVLQLLQPITAMAGNREPAAVCEQLAEQLNDKNSLAGLHIQLSPSNFISQDNGQELPFSTILAEGLAAALSAHGAILSVREQGGNPLRILGGYQLQDDQLTITVRIRQMGRSSSSDLAVARITADRDELQEAWFQADLATMAAGLVKDLEKNLPGVDDPIVTIEQPQPGIEGQPTLRFGTELRKQLAQAVSHSEFLGATSFGVKRSPYRLQTSYSRFAESMRIELVLLGPDAKPAALAQADIALQQIAPELLVLLDDRDLSVCIRYRERDRRDIREHSIQALSLIDAVSSALARYGTRSSTCSDNEDHQGIEVVSSLRLTKKNTRDGYGLLRGDLQLTILDSSGKIVSTLRAKEKMPSSGRDDSAVEKLIERIFDEVFREKLAAVLLGK